MGEALARNARAARGALRSARGCCAPARRRRRPFGHRRPSSRGRRPASFVDPRRPRRRRAGGRIRRLGRSARGSGNGLRAAAPRVR
ncbi:MAG: hypothetical protein E6J13_14115 [Chloroflexi bacterium]|nr:MAG: hypothetical protein E6J13_14115 [Chloroflexota bacterium]